MNVLEQQVVQDPNQSDPKTPPPPAEDLNREPEGTIDAGGGRRMAPVSAVIEERRARQSAQQERDRLAAENEALKKVKENWDVVEPYLPLLASHPKITGKPAAAAPAPEQDPELVRAAEVLGYYTEDGRPDVTRAKAAKELFRGEARSAAQEVVQPVAQGTNEVRAESLRQWAHSARDLQGRPFADPKHIDAILNQIPVESRANPQMVQAALLMARGMGVPPADEPLHTEGAGGAPGGGGKTLSGLERAAARARGLTDDQWIKARDNDSDVLE